MGLFDKAIGLLSGSPLDGDQGTSGPTQPPQSTTTTTTQQATSGIGPSVIDKVGGAFNVNFGGEGTNYIVILGVIAVLFILSRKK